MATNVQLKEAIAELRTQMGISEREVKERFQLATDIGYWQNLSPSMGIMDEQSLARLGHVTLSSEQEASALLHLARHGYFQMPPMLASTTVARMHSCVEAVHAAGWPAVFAWVYDEFWAALRTPPMVQFFSRQLGAGYLQSATGLWVHYVDPRKRGSGWVPHVDGTKDQGRITVWIPLMDVTVRSGCMYVIPEDRVPATLRTSFVEWTSISRQDLEALLHGVTPLPAAAGSVLGWSHRVIHWGGAATELAAGPRINLAADFLHEKSTPGREELPVFDASLPAFPVRLHVIGKSIRDYEKFEPLMQKYAGLVTKLIEWGS
jgi:hypothetical protein